MASISPCSWIAEWLEDTRNSRGKLSWLPPALSLFIFTLAMWKKEKWWVAKAIHHIIQVKRLISLWQSISAPAIAFPVGAADVKKEEKTGTVNDRWRMTSYNSVPSFQHTSFGSTAVLAQLTPKLMSFCLWLEANPNYRLLWPEPYRICHGQLSRFPKIWNIRHFQKAFSMLLQVLFYSYGQFSLLCQLLLLYWLFRPI